MSSLTCSGLFWPCYLKRNHLEGEVAHSVCTLVPVMVILKVLARTQKKKQTPSPRARRKLAPRVLMLAFPEKVKAAVIPKNHVRGVRVTCASVLVSLKFVI